MRVLSLTAHNTTCRRRRAFEMTDNELRVTIGDSRAPTSTTPSPLELASTGGLTPPSDTSFMDGPAEDTEPEVPFSQLGL